VTTSQQIFSDINIALHSLRMGSAKGAKVSTNDSTLGDPAAEKPPTKLSLGYPKTKKLSASEELRPLTPDQPCTHWGLCPQTPKRPPDPNLPLHH